MANKDISIPQELYESIERRVAKSDFSTVDEYAQYVLEQVIKKTEAQDSPKSETSKEQEEEVKDRLKGLGYLE